MFSEGEAAPLVTVFKVSYELQIMQYLEINYDGCFSLLDGVYSSTQGP